MGKGLQDEPRSRRATVALTDSEKDAVRLVCAIDETDESNLLRDHTVDWIVGRANQIRKKVAA